MKHILYFFLLLTTLTYSTLIMAFDDSLTITFELENKTLLDYLENLKDPRKNAIIDFHNQYLSLIQAAKGSNSKHQAWPGGYTDHLNEIFIISEMMYQTLSKFRKLPFTFDSALIVGYFHDIEKIWKYTTGEEIDKEDWYNEKLKAMKIEFSEQERNALSYIHGESDKNYDPNIRKMNELAAFCHAADNISARLWHNKGKGSGVNGSLTAR